MTNKRRGNTSKPKLIPPGPNHPWDPTYLTRLTKKWKKQGVSFSAEVFYTPNSFLQVGIRAAGVGRIRRTSRTKFRNATDELFDQLCDEVTLIPCKTCHKNKAFDPKIHKKKETNRHGQCEKCFMKPLRDAAKAEEEKCRQEEERMDALKKGRGFRYKLIAWVHPKSGGDDFGFVKYFKTKPSKKIIRNMLKRKSSALTDDYTLDKL